VADDQVSGEFRFDVTGDGLKKLESLSVLLEQVDNIALSTAKTVNLLSQSIANDAKIVRNAVSAYRSYAAALDKATRSQLALKKAAQGTITTPTTTAGTTTTPTTATPKSVTSDAAKRAAAEQKALMDAQKIADAEAARIQREAVRRQEKLAAEASAFLAKEDAKRAASSKASAAAQEQAAREAAREAITEAEMITKAQVAQAAAAERARKAALAAESKYLGQLSNTRYALYDISRTASIVGIALSAAVVVPTIAAAKFEANFASVARTVNLTGDAAEHLRQQFEDLSTTIPATFADLSQIGTLAGQLDIPAESVANFTQVVAKFSATTNVGVEEAATNIGRLAQLTGTAASEYENLGSAIYQVGVTSVATESEILDMGSQIATAGDLAGLSNTQIIALAGALASLGVQPEAARGSLQRIFNIIENGATSSTDATQKLADATGMTLDQLKALWKQGDAGSQQVFSAFVQGLQKMQAAGENTTNFLASMGIHAVRDQRLLQVLANNTDVYSQALENSASAYSDATALAEGYAKQTDNVANNFQVLMNTLSALIAALGDSDGALNSSLKAFNSLAQVWLGFTRIPGVQYLTMIAGSMIALGAAMAIQVAIAAKFQGTMYGMVTAATGVRNISGTLSISLGTLTKQLLSTSAAFLKGSLSGQSFRTMLQQDAAAAAQASTALTGEAAAAARGVAVTKTLGATVVSTVGSFVKFNAVLLAITAALWGAQAIYEKFTETASDRAHKMFGEDNSALIEALKQDTAEYQKTGKAIRTFQTEVGNSSDTMPEWGKQLQVAAKGQDALRDSAKGATDEIKSQTLAIGDNLTQQLANDVANLPDLKDVWAKYSAELKGTDFSLPDFFSHLKQDADSGVAYVQKRIEDLQAEAYRLALVPGSTTATQAQKDAANARIAQIEAEISVYKVLSGASESTKTRVEELTLAQDLLGAASGQTTQATAQAADGMRNLADSAGTTADEGKTLADVWSSLKTKLEAPYDLAASWEDLGKSLVENGQQFDGLGEKARTNMSKVLDVIDQVQKASGNDTNKFGENILGAMVALQKQGVVSGKSMRVLGNILQDTLGGTYNLDFNSAEAQTNILGVINSAIAAQQAIISLQNTAIASAQTAAMAGDVAAQQAMNAALAKRVAAENALQALQALRTAAMAASAAAQKSLNAGIQQGTAALNKNTGATRKNTSAAQKQKRTLSDWVDDLQQVMDAADNFRWGLEDAWKAVQKAQQDAAKVLVETVYDIEGAYTKFFSYQDYKDSLASMFYDMQDAAQQAASDVVDATNKIKEATASLAEIGSDRTNLQYGLNVAVMYGDDLRAASIRAKLTELDAKEASATKDLADAQRDLADAYDAQDKSLTGTSKQAIANRKTVQDLLGVYSDYIKQLAESGASNEDIASAVAQAKEDFLAQAESMGFAANELTTYADLFNAFAATTASTVNDADDAVRALYDSWQNYILKLAESGASQKEINQAIADGRAAVEALAKQMGLSQAEIDKYGAAFDGMIKIIAKVPKNVNVSVDADTDPATRAIKEFLAKNTGGKGASGGIDVPVDVAYKGEKSSARQHAEDMMDKYAKLIMGTSNMAALTDYSKKWTYWQRQALKSLWTGGFTGRGNKYDEAGIVHKGEYVFPKKDVNQNTGLPYLMERVQNQNTTNNIARMPSVIMVELSPTDRALLAATGGDLIVQLDGKQIAASVNTSNHNSSIRGNS